MIDPVATSPERQIRVLLVEDHDYVRATTACLLQYSGYIVYPVQTVSDALALADKQQVDVLISDIGFKGRLSGYDLMGELSRRYGIPGIALTGRTLPEDINASLTAGFSAHIAKPATIVQLDDAIRHIQDMPTRRAA